MLQLTILGDAREPELPSPRRRLRALVAEAVERSLAGFNAGAHVVDAVTEAVIDRLDEHPTYVAL